MKPTRAAFTAATLVALFLTACEFDDGIARREREKPEAYASLHVWQKRFIEKGVIAKGFTADMVYMAMGNPRSLQRGNDRELWTYTYYYPPGDASRVQFHYYGEEALHDHNIILGMAMEKINGLPGTVPQPLGSELGMHGATPYAFRPGPPQGGSMEPADLQSYTVQVLFEGGKVTRIGAVANIN